MNEPLSAREIEILRLAADGCANGEIAVRLSLSLNTVKWYSKRIYERLAVTNRAQAVQRAQTLGLLTENGQSTQPALPDHNLPSPLTTFVGRRAEIDTVKQLLKQHRLLTLTGPGGIGKTRLALQVAAEIAGFYPDGVCFVDLAAINESALVTNTLAHVLDVAESPDTPLTTLIQAALRDKQFLLILDNFEHLLDAAPLVAELLAASRTLKVLVTSREVLALYGEQEYAVPPLQLPDLEGFAAHHLAPTTLLNSEALQLFERCAQAVYPAFRLTRENTPAVASICLRLDGLPLAIELAAAYIKLLSPQAMLTQLDSLWLEMKRPLRNIPARQQTLRNTIEWSYRSLDEEERRFFAQLAVFRGGCSWEAINAICVNPSSGASTAALFEPLNGLVNKSLVWRRTDGNGEPRFGMLETIREYALSCLQARGEVETLRQSHAHYYAHYSTRISAEIMRINQRQVRNELSSEWDNLRAALRWAVELDPEPGYRILCMIGDLSICWRIRDHQAEGLAWAQQLLATQQPVSLPVQARTYASMATLAYVFGCLDQARQWAEQAYLLSQQVADRPTRAQALHAWITAHSAPNLTVTEYEQILLLGNEAAQLYEEGKDLLGRGRILNELGEVERLQQRYAQAKGYYEESYQVLGAVGYQSGMSISLANLGWTLVRLGQHQEALTTCYTSAQQASELDFSFGVEYALAGAAAALAGLNQLQPAIRVLSAADVINKSIRTVLLPIDEPDYAWIYSELQTKVGPADFDRYWQAGRALTAAEAISIVNEFC